MRFAVLADMHANREAMQAVLAHATQQQVQRHVFLGDMVGYGADPAWVVDAVREHVSAGALAVLGNHDAAVVLGSPPTMRPDARLAVQWTRQQLDPRQLDFMSSLPLTQQWGDLLFVHANAHEPAGWGYVQDRVEAGRSLHARSQRVIFCGHLHEPMLFNLSPLGKVGEFVPVPGEPIPLLAPRRWLAVAGAVGQPRDGNPAACYCVYDDDRAELTYWRVPYDREAASAKIVRADLPPFLASRLADGI